MKIRLLQLRKDDTGQGALEYIGILAVVAIVIGLVVAGFQASEGNIADGISTLLDGVFAPRG